MFKTAQIFTFIFLYRPRPFLLSVKVIQSHIRANFFETYSRHYNPRYTYNSVLGLMPDGS